MIDIESSTTHKKNRIIISTWKYLYTTVISMFFCPECNWSGLNLSERFMKKKGLASLLAIQLYLALIVNTKWEYYTSKLCGKGYDINCRTMYTMCTCGQGYSGIERFCCSQWLASLLKKCKHCCWWDHSYEWCSRKIEEWKCW